MELKKGDRVRYVPSHSNGDIKHPDCQEGVVKRGPVYASFTGEECYFVIYDNAVMKMVTGDEPYTATLTGIRYLQKIN